MTAFLVYALVLAFALGFACGACLFSRPRKRRNTEAPYFKGDGEPQPFGEWRPEYADLLRRKGAV